MELRRQAWLYLGGHRDVLDLDDLNGILFWTRLETDVLQAHSDFLATGKRYVESQGRLWTVEEMVRYEQETES
jgi:hypothetical protein